MDPKRVRWWLLTVACIAPFLGGVGLEGKLNAYAAVKSKDVTRGPVRIPERWVPGYVTDVAGEVISYPSAYPGQTRALLTRATDGAKRIEWEAEQPPAGEAGDAVHFVWHAGLASGYGAHRFTLSLNGTQCAEFTSGRDTTDREWTVTGERGVSLSFKTTQVGNFDELFGLMILSVPRHLLAPGRPRISVVGEAAGNQDYYMTFLRPVDDWARVVGEQAVLKDGRRALRVEVSHIGNESEATLLADQAAIWTGRVGPGYTSLFLPAPPRAELAVTLQVAGRPAFSRTLLLSEPVRHWEIHLLPHSHVDIGYSDPQPEVERKQWKNLGDAVALAEKTAAYPRGARFKWNVEGLWCVESYLRQASASQRAAFIQAVKNGSIGLQANYTNILTGLASPEELVHWTDAARELRAEYGLPPAQSAMHTDIPGLSWTSVRALAEGGVRYFSSGPNFMPSLPDRGDRIGHTLNALGDRPFWWASPSGNERILFWMAGRGYSWFHGLNMGSAFRAGRMPLLDYVRELQASAYAWDMVQVRYTIGGDNGPVDPQLPDFVKAWNETFDWPRLVINTADEMFAEFERRHGSTLPTLSGDMTPYWEDGAISSAAEESLVRASARRLVQAETLWSLRDAATFPAREAANAWRNVLLWHEHTWGAADSINQPDRQDVVAQWAYKLQFALDADRQSKALLEGALGGGPRSARDRRSSQGPTWDYRSSADAAWDGRSSADTAWDRRSSDRWRFVDVVNTLSWPRKGLVVLDAVLTKDRGRVSDSAGRPVPSQRLADGRLAVLVPAVRALGTTRLKIARGTPNTPVGSQAGIDGDRTIDNGLLRVAIDEKTGDISSLRFQTKSITVASPAGAGTRPGGQQSEHALEFASPSTGLNRYVYVPGRNPDDSRTSGPSRVSVEERGPLVATLRIESDGPGARSLVRRVTVVAGEPTVQIEDLVDKIAVRTKESAHVAFPFNVPGATVRVDEGGAIVTPERHQLNGSCRDFIGTHSAVDVANDGVGIALVTLDAPLVEIGAVTDERQDPKTRVRTWRSTTAPGSNVYAYLLNNYWHTNYKADQEGLLTFRFVLRPHAGGSGTRTSPRNRVADGTFDTSALRRLSADYEQPLLARPVAAGPPILSAPIRLESPDVAVSSIRYDRATGALLLRLYNPSERPASARIASNPAGAKIRLEMSDDDRKTAGVMRETILLKPFATAVVRVYTTAGSATKARDE